MRLETLAIHAGSSPDTSTGAVIPPITVSVMYERGEDGVHESGYYYSTMGNPNRDSLERRVAALEGGAEALAFASGCAAITAVFRTLAPGDHVLVPQDLFQGTIRILRQMLPRWGIECSAVDMRCVDAIKSALRERTRIVWIETLSNPQLQVTDVRAVSRVAHDAGALCVVDNSFVTPVFQQPLLQGADLVVHATTKFMGGHGDVVGGIVVGSNASTLAALREIQHLEGAVPSPFDCWLVLRGLKTLACRMRAQADTALHVARWLSTQDNVEAVHYPGLETHPQHELAAELLTGFGSIVSFQLRKGRTAALAVASGVHLITNTTSFGATESLIQHQASAPTHGFGTGLAENLLRLSVGLEHPADLVEDLRQALQAARR